MDSEKYYSDRQKLINNFLEKFFASCRRAGNDSYIFFDS